MRTPLYQPCARNANDRKTFNFDLVGELFLGTIYPKRNGKCETAGLKSVCLFVCFELQLSHDFSQSLS